ncbi:putative membrane-bound metal-dependent hydrolase (DUF457) (plasmid) [Thermobacillus composti KWC4]|uniref:Putative membrane-bound metal-dependent hydrolase (DUF457) n=1 Tax=Thermobacillus composti (strain DSM 18247 / JCM 13945 / KWC4) TaxID=717605 RepID=L0EJW1_THECK|nr:metal-dependent hydrolase [Thermobacillus composti]AGA60081.1 putative membrane-bound metal-dependent hydrolase (DUF457) [Thermobacillus composti KWC4]
MMGRSHLVIGTGVTLSVLGAAGENITLPVVAVAAVSSLLPDIDEPNSLLVSRIIPTRFLQLFQLAVVGLAVLIHFYGKAYAPWNTILAVFAAVVSFLPNRTLRSVVMVLLGIGIVVFGERFIPWNLIVGCLLIVCSFLPHRGLTHTVYGVVGWSALLYFATFSYGHALWVAGGLSYLLHLLADSLTNRGIRPLPPFEWRLRLRLMSTGNWSGAIVENVFIGLTFVLVWFVFFRHGNLASFIS